MILGIMERKGGLAREGSGFSLQGAGPRKNPSFRRKAGDGSRIEVSQPGQKFADPKVNQK